MNKNKLINLKNRIVSLGVIGLMLGLTGCDLLNDNEIPECYPINESYSNFDLYSKYVIENGEAKKVYKSKNVYLGYNKETNEIEEFIFKGAISRDSYTNRRKIYEAELYDLESEKMLVRYDAFTMYTVSNIKYFEYILDNYDIICLDDISDYIEEHEKKDYYSLDEIRELEPKFLEALRTIYESKEKESK